MPRIFVPFLKKVIGYVISQTKGLNGLFASHRFRFIAEKEIFKIAVAVHIKWGLITTTKVYILFEVCYTSCLDANKNMYYFGLKLYAVAFCKKNHTFPEIFIIGSRP